MKMKRLVAKVAVTATIAASLVGGTAMAANAVTAGGGTWYYGVEGIQAWNYSHYLHNSYYHRATAYHDGGMVRAYGEAGQWAMARQRAAVSGNKAAWYHNYGGRDF